MQGVWTTMYFNQPSSKLFSKFFLNLFIFFITNNDLSGIDSTHVQYTRLAIATGTGNGRKALD